jgi:hypothetical protein
MAEAKAGGLAPVGASESRACGWGEGWDTASGVAKARAQQPGWRPGGSERVGGRRLRCGGRAGGARGRRPGHWSLGAAGDGCTGREWRRWARGSWWCGSDLSERERGRGARCFFG